MIVPSAYVYKTLIFFYLYIGKYVRVESDKVSIAASDDCLYSLWTLLLN